MPTQSPVLKKHPLSDLPSFTWQEDGQNWNEKLVTHDSQQLIPVAWFRQQLEDQGLDINYESPLFGKQGTVIRTPCVILGGDSDIISSASGGFKERFDALPVIHARIPTPSLEDGAFVNGLRELLFGLPHYGEEGVDNVKEVKDHEKYVGGRVYVIQGVHGDAQPYYEEDYEGFAESTISVEYCTVEQGLEAGVIQCGGPQQAEACEEAGESTAQEVEHDPINCTLIKEEASNDENEDIAELERHIPRYDKFRICAWFEREIRPIVIRDRCLCGFFDESAICGTVPLEGEIEIGDDSALIETVKTKWMQIWGMIPAENRFIRGSEITNSEILSDMLTFFEEPRPD